MRYLLHHHHSTLSPRREPHAHSLAAVSSDRYLLCLRHADEGDRLHYAWSAPRIRFLLFRRAYLSRFALVCSLKGRIIFCLLASYITCSSLHCASIASPSYVIHLGARCCLRRCSQGTDRTLCCAQFSASRKSDRISTRYLYLLWQLATTYFVASLMHRQARSAGSPLCMCMLNVR